jgi:hypothetical protein
MVVMLIGANTSSTPCSMQLSPASVLELQACAHTACRLHAVVDATAIAAGVLFFGFLIGAVGEFLEVGSSSENPLLALLRPGIAAPALPVWSS